MWASSTSSRSGCGYTTGLRPFLRSAYSLCQFWAIGPGRYKRDERGDVFELRRVQAAQQRADRPTFELEHADGVAPAQQIEGLGIVERDVVDVGTDAAAVLDEVAA